MSNKRATDRAWKEYKDSVRVQLPELVIKFYTARQKNYISYEEEVIMGRVIADINNPFSGITDDMGEPLPNLKEIASRVAIKMNVNRFKTFVKTL